SAAADPAPAPTTVPSAPSAPAPASPSSRAGVTRSVSYGGVSARVPGSWRVVDLDKTPGACVRLDVATVYLGAASEQQDCPAHAVGRADTLWLAPSAVPVRAPADKVGVMSARVTVNETSHEQVAAVAGRQVVVQTTWGSSRSSIDTVLKTVTPTAGAVPRADLQGARTSPSVASSALGSAPNASSGAGKVTPFASSTGGSEGEFTGLGMDTCAAPSLSTMRAWKASRYRAAGIYIGGSLRACGDGNLSASWVSSVSAEGWGLMPIYVGLQAPCVTQRGLATISTASASSQGSAAATDAIAKARKFGIGTGRPIYYDMEDYGAGDSCRSTVLSFLSAWTSVLHRSGYLSGVYGGPGSVMSDMGGAGSSFAAPDHVWFAYWNGIASSRAQSSYPRFSDSTWADHQRLHQYAGNITETWGGVRMQLDANWIDAKLAGNAVPVNYGAHTTGPVGPNFGWTGPMSSWRSMTAQGLRSHAAWSGSSGTSAEVNGASWSMYLTPGTYSAMAYLPSDNSTGRARYSIRGAGVSVNSVLDQAGVKGYRSVGSFTLRSAGTVVVHVGDNGGSPARTPFAVDAMWFRPMSSPPPAQPAAPAVPGMPSQLYADVANGSSTVRWVPPTSGGPVAGYSVTTSPGGRVVAVSAGARKVTVTGLRNGTAYRFSVAARNSSGSGLVASTGSVLPVGATRLTSVGPVRLVDTRKGTPFNRVGTALGAGRSLTIGVSGLPGSPVPSWATGAQLHFSVVAPSSGWLTTPAGAVSYGPSQVTASSRLFPLSAKSVTVTNRGPSAVHLLVDAEGYASASGERWTPTSHARLLDTRIGTSSNSRRTAIPAGGSVAVRVAGTSGSPVPSGAASALFNVTAASSAGGYLTMGSDRTSVVSFGANWTVASTTMSKVAPNGTVSVTNHSSRSLTVLVDVQGYGSATRDQWTMVPPTRIISSATGTVASPSRDRLPPRGSLTVQVRDTRGTPLPGTASGAAVSVEVSSARAGGYLTGSSVAGAPSLLNFSTGGSASNTALLPISSAGTITITNMSTASVSLIVDVTAYTGG
ncbi:MAG: glycoside hydrolase domain-containing protein, partial [Allobranchiibius sp.]